MAQAIERQDATLTWSGSAVDVTRIERELERLRYEAAGAPAGGERFAIRTSVLNLVVHAADEEVARHAAQVVAGLPSHHPSRTLISVARPSGGESRIDAQLAAHCHIAAGLEQHVCCEEVTLEVSGPAARHLHSIIIPLLVSDLPLYVWWMGDVPQDQHVLEELLEGADRLIVDSAQFGEAAEGLARLQGIAAEHPQVAVGDLNWGRLAAWRQLLIHHLPDLGPAAGVEVRFVKGGGPGQALLLLAWLANRLGWEPAGDTGGRRLALRSREGRRIAAMVQPEERSDRLERGWLVSVAMRGRAKAASLSIGRTDDPWHLMVRLEGPSGTMESRVRIEACSEAEMVAGELDALGHDREYEAALRRAIHLHGSG